MSTRSLTNAETVAAPVSELEEISLPGATDPSDPSNGPTSVAGSSGALSAAARGFVNLVEGSTPHLSADTHRILRRRLFMAAVLFFVGFAAFWVKGLVLGRPDYQFTDPAHAEFVASELSLLRWFHLAVTMLMGVAIFWLHRSVQASMTALRLTEYAIFGGVALFFLVVTHTRFEIEPWLAVGNHLPAIVPPWMLLIFTYALFIPNSWQRALRYLGPITAAPIAVMFAQKAFCPGFQMCELEAINADYASAQTMILLLSCATATVGVHTINALRTEAFEARQLGQYRLKHLLGKGGMGEVYLAEHQMMKRPCAIKVIRRDKAGEGKALARFEREVRSTAKLSHWNSIDIFDYGRTDDGTFYYVMEYLPGHNVGELVDQSGPLAPERVVYLMEQVCRALSEAHGIGLVHRDIKPANIFCSYRGGEFDVAKLLDFGLAKPTSDVQDAALTAAGAITGSPLFMSPEQATGEREADVRSDIYSLGCVLYYLLTGKPPFEYSQPVKVIIAHASEESVPMRRHNPALPVELEEVVSRCLEKDPEHRFQSVDDLRDALLEVPLSDPWSAERAGEWWQCNGCPERKELAAKAIEAAAM